jgi:PAS domain S-box-containing protein
VLPDGEVRIVHQEAEVVLDETGRAIRMVGTVQDITERKTAEDALRAGEARLKAIIDNSPAVIGLKDVEGRYLTVNRTFEKICGVENGDIQGRTAYDIFEKDVADAFTALEQQVLKTGEPVEAEITVATVDGERIFMVVSFPVPPGPGTDDLPIATGLIATDITERKHVETELVAAKEQAELASRAKSDFLANMSHELRTPLNAIIGFSDIIQNETFGAVGNDKYVEYAKDINDSGAHLLELINDILDLSKVEAGKLELHEEDVDLGDAIRSCLTLVRDRAAIEGLALEGEVPEFLAKLRADERKIKQILLNLLSNAIKFTPRGGRVTVRASAEGDDVVIAVSDTGVGMTPEEIETAMTPFGQVTGHMDRTHEGTGLGLPLTKALIELHGGRLELTSEPGSGTTARITLPAAGIAGANTTAA